MLDEEMELLAEFLKDSKEVWTFDGPVHWTPDFLVILRAIPGLQEVMHGARQYLKPLNLNHESY